jgi:hypothetical protein
LRFNAVRKAAHADMHSGVPTAAGCARPQGFEGVGETAWHRYCERMARQ